MLVIVFPDTTLQFLRSVWLMAKSPTAGSGGTLPVVSSPKKSTVVPLQTRSYESLPLWLMAAEVMLHWPDGIPPESVGVTPSELQIVNVLPTASVPLSAMVALENVDPFV